MAESEAGKAVHRDDRFGSIRHHGGDLFDEHRAFFAYQLVEDSAVDRDVTRPRVYQEITAHPIVDGHGDVIGRGALLVHGDGGINAGGETAD